MKRATWILPPLLAAALAGGCVVSLVSFLVPSAVLVGSTFEVVVVGNQGSGTFGEQVGAVLQLPAGFAVTGGWAFNTGFTTPPPPVIQDDPAVLSLYTPEPGSSLTSFSGGSSTSLSNPIALRVRIQAPAVAGTYTLKVSLAAIAGGAWQAQDPPGVATFASITAATHAKAVAVLAAPTAGAPAWLDDSSGLPLFQPQTTSDPQGWGGIAFGDVDGDGRDDLACIARLGDGPHVFLHGNPGDWIETSNGLAGSSGRSDVAFGDFDADGFLDLADGNGKAWLGDGGSSWTLAVAGISASGMEGVAVGDANGDGFDDVAFSGHFSPVLQFYLSNGDGTWTASGAGLPTTQPPGTSIAGGHKLLLRDVSGDGLLDLVWARYDAPGIWLGDGAGGWTEVAGNGIEPLNAFGVDAADLDGDGDADVVFGVIGIQGSASAAGLRVYRQQPGPQWILDPSSGLPTSGPYYDVAAADLDRDGLLDLVAGRGGLGGLPDNGVDVWRGLGGGTFAAAPGAVVSGLPVEWIGNLEGIAVGDVNDDTFPDVGVASYGMGIAVFVNEMSGFSRYGAGCAGSSPFLPAIGSSGGGPTLGNAAFAWTVSGAPPSAPCLLVLGTSKTSLFGVPALPLPLDPFGAPGCSLLAEPAVLLPSVTSATGAAGVGTPVPNSTSILLATVFGQWGVFGPGANPLGIVFSEGAAARIGP